MGKTIYVVTAGVYSDYSIYGVYDDQEVAQKISDAISADWAEARVEEYELNEYADKVKQGLSMYAVQMDVDGNALSIEKLAYTDETFVNEARREGATVLFARVYAKSEEHAIKIVNERRLQLIASNQWGKSVEV